MWPWEHAIVGYFAYSVFCHAYYRDSPGDLEAFAVVFASVLPDIIDKPLAWEYGLFETGYGIGHSIFFAVPFAIVVGLVARSAGRSRAGLAFGIGYLLHLPSDVLHHYAVREELQFEILLWPVATGPPEGIGAGFVDRFFHFFDQYSAQLLAGELSTYMWLQAGLALCTVLLWLYDGAPVLRGCLRNSKRLAIVAVSRVQRRAN